MRKKSASTRRPAVVKRKPDGLAPLIAEVRGLIQSARHAAASTVNTLQVLTNFEIGRRIVEHEQKGGPYVGCAKSAISTLFAIGDLACFCSAAVLLATTGLVPVER